DAVDRLRAGVTEPMRIPGSTPLVSWSGGEVTPAEASMWLATMAAPERAAYRIKSDTAVSRDLRIMAQREILNQVAIARGTQPGPIRERVNAEISESLVRLQQSALSVGSATEWFQAVMQGRMSFQPLPGALPAVLRDRL